MDISVTLLLKLLVQLSLVNGWYEIMDRVKQYRYILCLPLGTVAHAKIAQRQPSLSFTLPKRVQQKVRHKWDLRVNSASETPVWHVHKKGPWTY